MTNSRSYKSNKMSKYFIYMNLWNIFHKIQYLLITSISYIFYLLSCIPIPHLDFVQLYILVTFSLVGIFFYIKIRYPFWNVQPIYHSYDYWRKMYKTPFVIQKGIPLKTKFTKVDDVTCLNLTDITDDHLKQCIDILQTSYISSDKVLLTLSSNNLRTWLSGTTNNSLLTFYNDITYTITENNEIVPKTIPIGCIFSKPIHFFYLNNQTNKTTYVEMPIYYWDYICILKKEKGKHISRKIIQTNEYIQRIQTPEISSSLFKKEVSLCEGIVSLIKYNSYTYYLRNIRIDPLPPHFMVVKMDYLQNKDILMNFLGGLSSPDNKKLFEIICIPSVSNILEMTKDFQIYCFCLKLGNNIYGIYIFKDENVLYEDLEHGNTIHLIASINNSSDSNLFYSGYIHSIKMIIKQNKKRKQFRMIMIDETSHNKILLSFWNQRFSKIIETPTAYYLYNFFYPKTPLPPENTLIIL